MQIRGTITIAVDDVEIEQLTINSPELVRAMPDVIKASVAARHHEDFIKIWRICARNNTAIEYLQAERHKDWWVVAFKIREKTKEELAA